MVAQHQGLLIGREASGKTFLLNNITLKQSFDNGRNFKQHVSTYGFNYEMIEAGSQSYFGIWDIGANEIVTS